MLPLQGVPGGPELFIFLMYGAVIAAILFVVYKIYLGYKEFQNDS